MKTPLHAVSALLATALCLGGATARAKCTYFNQMTIPVHYQAGSALPLVYGSINGKQAPMSINTGAYTTALLASQAERRGLVLRTRYETTFDSLNDTELQRRNEAIVGTGEHVATYLASIKEFAIGPVKAPRGKLPVIDSQASAPYDAIVGADFLLQADLELALAENRIRFFRGIDCADAFLAYWDENALVVPLEKTDFPQAVIGIKLNGKPALAMIDTGTVRSFVVPAFAASLGVREPPAGAAAAAGKSGGEEEPIDAWLARFDTLTIGGATFEAPYLYVSRNGMARPVPYQVVLGLDFLKVHRVLLANSQQRMYFSVNASGKAFPDLRPSVHVEQLPTGGKH